jgi:branched-chain amino acid transport system substrate-binding protein
MEGKGLLSALVLIPLLCGGARAADEITIGVLYPLSGLYTATGKQAINGVSLAFEETGNQISGRKVRLIVEDDEAKPEVALTKAKKLVESDRVPVLFGINWSPSAMALRDYVHEHKVPFVVGEAAVRPITQEAGSPYIFRTAFSSGQLTYSFGAYACGKLGYHKLVVIAFDSVFGRDESDFFEAGCKQSGGAVVEKIYAPIQTADFAPYFARVQQDNPNAVLGIWDGAGSVRFLNQYSEFGMKQKYPLVAFGSLVDEVVINAVGEAAKGVISYYDYSPAIDTPQNKRFVEAYHNHFGIDPGVHSAAGYVVARTIIAAAKAVGGDLSNTGQFLTALSAVQFEAPNGRFRFDAHHQAIKNVYIRKVQAGEGGQLVNAPIDVLNDIEQYWPKGKPAK